MPFFPRQPKPPKQNDGTVQVFEGDGNVPGFDQARLDVLEWQRAHRKLLNFPKRKGNWRWVSGDYKNAHGHDVRFCWSVHRNVADYFVTWREVWRPIPASKAEATGSEVEFTFQYRKHWYHITRFDVIARRSRKKCKAIATERHLAWPALVKAQREAAERTKQAKNALGKKP